MLRIKKLSAFNIKHHIEKTFTLLKIFRRPLKIYRGSANVTCEYSIARHTPWSKFFEWSKIKFKLRVNEICWIVIRYIKNFKDLNEYQSVAFADKYGTIIFSFSIILIGNRPLYKFLFVMARSLARSREVLPRLFQFQDPAKSLSRSCQDFVWQDFVKILTRFFLGKILDKILSKNIFFANKSDLVFDLFARYRWSLKSWRGKYLARSWRRFMARSRPRFLARSWFCPNFWLNGRTERCGWSRSCFHTRQCCKHIKINFNVFTYATQLKQHCQRCQWRRPISINSMTGCRCYVIEYSLYQTRQVYPVTRIRWSSNFHSRIKSLVHSYWWKWLLVIWVRSMHGLNMSHLANL